MSKQELQRMLERQAEESHGQRRIKQLADGLMFVMDIPPCGRELVVWLGDSDSRHNRDAVVHWLANDLALIQSDPSTVDPALLKQRLILRLDALKEIGS